MGKILFAVLMSVGVVICLMGGAYNLAIFFGIIVAVTIWLKNREKKNELPRR